MYVNETHFIPERPVEVEDGRVLAECGKATWRSTHAGAPGCTQCWLEMRQKEDAYLALLDQETASIPEIVDALSRIPLTIRES